MTLPQTRLLALALLVIASSAAHAQTTPDVPSTTPPNAITPPGGIARGVIRPQHRPVDGSMVKHPPTNGQHKMPVIRPPGTSR